MACQMPLKSGLPSAVRAALYCGAAAGAVAAGRVCAFCAGDATIPCIVTTRTAMTATRIQILHSNRAPAHRRFDGSSLVVPLFQQVRDRYKTDSALIPAGRDVSALSTIGPVICT